MLPIDVSFLYGTSKQIAPLSTLTAETPLSDCWITVAIAHYSLDMLLNKSVFQLTTCRQEGLALLASLQKVLDSHNPGSPATDAKLGWPNQHAIQTELAKFEAVLAAELRPNIYLVTSTMGLDTAKLIADGSVAFPKDLGDKVPAAIPDAKEAMKCIVFELPTAAGFHLHRANESVLHKFYEAVAPGRDAPKTRKIGDYLKKLDEFSAGDKIVKAALRDLKDLHRNPLIHPETSLSDVDEAYALYCGVFAAMQAMLKAIPVPPLSVIAPPAS